MRIKPSNAKIEQFCKKGCHKQCKGQLYTKYDRRTPSLAPSRAICLKNFLSFFFNVENSRFFQGLNFRNISKTIMDHHFSIWKIPEFFKD